jgi:hypothetical protein
MVTKRGEEYPSRKPWRGVPASAARGSVRFAVVKC